MTIFLAELKRNRRAFGLWAGVVGLMLAICILIYPEMREQMDSISALFSSMGSFTAAFGMDKIDFGTAMGFYGVECGNVLGIGGAFFAALLGARALSGEEAGHTAEFLFAHPVSRKSAVLQKLAGVIAQIFLFNAISALIGFAAFVSIGESVDGAGFLRFHLAQLLMQVEVGLMCFGLSAFLHRGSAGVGLGLAALLYFLNILQNLSDRAAFLRFLTPFAYADASFILSEGRLMLPAILTGMALGLLSAGIGLFHYCRKDLLA